MKIIKAILAAVAIMFAANAQAVNDQFLDVPMNKDNALCFAMRVPVAKAAKYFYKLGANQDVWRGVLWGMAKDMVKPIDQMQDAALRGRGDLVAAIYVGKWAYMYEDEANNARELVGKFFNDCAADPRGVLRDGPDFADKMILAAAEDMMYEDE